MKKLIGYLKLMRVHHYIKNLLIFIPLIFAKLLGNWEFLKTTIIGFISFSLIASVIYIINDVVDIEADRKHEKKKNRPLASGLIKKGEAIVLGIILFVISGLLNYYIKANAFALCIIYGYFVMNLLYSFYLKRVPIVDVVIIALGFLFRVLFGAQIVGIVVSDWLYITVLSLCFYLGLGKRRNEIKKVGKGSRKVLNYYNETFLTNNMYMFMGLGIVFYSLWCIDVGKTIHSAINIIWTVPLIFIIAMKYSLDVEGDSYGDPVDVILKDYLLIGLCALYGLIMFLALYIV